MWPYSIFRATSFTFSVSSEYNVYAFYTHVVSVVEVLHVYISCCFDNGPIYQIARIDILSVSVSSKIGTFCINRIWTNNSRFYIQLSI